MSFRYEITRNELYVTRFPIVPVLQCKYIENNTNPARQAFLPLLREYLHTYDKRLHIDDINEEIYAIVDKLKQQMPYCFETTGYYTKNILAHLFEEGRLTYDGEKVYPAELEAKKLIRLERIKELYILQEKKDELKRIAQEEELALYNTVREGSRELIVIGTTFKSQKELYENFEDLFPSQCNDRIRKEIIAGYIKVTYDGRLWTVVDIVVPGRLKYLMSKRT